MLQAVNFIQTAAAWCRQKFAADVDHPPKKQLGGQIDYPGAADAPGRFFFNGVNLKFPGIRVYRNFIDDPRTRRHAHAGDPAFQGRAGGAGTGDQPVLVAEHHFGIGSHIHQNGGLFFFINFRVQNPGNQISAKVAADVGENQGSGIGIYLDAQSPGLYQQAVC